MVKLYVSIDGVYSEVDMLDFSLTKKQDYTKGDALSFTTKPDVPLSENSWVKLTEDDGEVVFRGSLASMSGSPTGPIDWDCLSIQASLRNRFTSPKRYGAPAVMGSYRALELLDVVSSDPPSQTVDEVNRYVIGAIWEANSLLSVEPDNQDDGIWYYPGWGTNSRAGNADVYMAGHKCTEISGGYSEDAITSDYYQCMRNENDLWIYGFGEGDKYGPIYLSNAFDSGLRVGNVDRVNDKILASIDLGVENVWTFVTDLFYSLGIYPSVRHRGNYTYLDGFINNPERGSSSKGFFTLKVGDWYSIKRTKPKNPVIAAFIGEGEGEGLTAIRETRCDPTWKGPWIEELKTFEGGLPSPFGTLDSEVDLEWETLRVGTSANIKTKLDIVKVGDWVTVETPVDKFTSQVSSITRDMSPARSLKVGAKDATIENAFWEKQRSNAVIAYKTGSRFGSQTDSDLLGYTETFTMNWTPAAAADRDTQRVLFTLSLSESVVSNSPNLSVTYTVAVNGTNVAILRNQAWASATPIFELNITDACYLDGSQETLTVTVSDPTGSLAENISYTGVVEGIGRYGQTPIETANYQLPAITSTLTGNIYVGQWDFAGGQTSGEALYYLEDAAVPNFDFKVVLVHRVKLTGYSSQFGESRPYIKTHGVVYQGQKRAVTTSEQQFEDDFDVNPYTKSPWTATEINELQVGIWLMVNPHYVSWIYKNFYDTCTCTSLRVELR